MVLINWLIGRADLALSVYLPRNVGLSTTIAIVSIS